MNLERTPSTVVSYPRWLRGWCALTAATTFALIAIGTLVTTFRVGMADNVWPTPPWHLIFQERSASLGRYVAHSPGLAGYSAGVPVLVQPRPRWRHRPTRARRYAALAAIFVLAAATALGMYLVRQAPERSVAALGNWGFLSA